MDFHWVTRFGMIIKIVEVGIQSFFFLSLSLSLCIFQKIRQGEATGSSASMVLTSLIDNKLSIEFGVMACFIYYGREEYKTSLGSCLDHFFSSWYTCMTKFCFRSLYSHVSNKVLFSEFESEFLLSRHGLEHMSCILYFSVLMNDLVGMLKTEICILN